MSQSYYMCECYRFWLPPLMGSAYLHVIMILHASRQRRVIAAAVLQRASSLPKQPDARDVANTSALKENIFQGEEHVERDLRVDGQASVEVG
ncbi:hypothetical protein CALVIDRAFT_600424 [Calocera viscosa TUFC12733]|uniref:Uncharacterized protein n=1 Tax=Calocera viscosa (strain TUFC12733) TaxID=1330018 RepID=A0A167JV95_CALVF|nr:hypothetical protein CALVIDRAFT_600424 [Calocera viscosa TUFC12733]